MFTFRNGKQYVPVINLTTWTFIATARGGTAFSFVCRLYNNNMVAGSSRCSAIYTICFSCEPGLCTGLVKNVSTVQQDSIVVPIRLMTNGADVIAF